jgi:hypothetical protein
MSSMRGSTHQFLRRNPRDTYIHAFVAAEEIRVVTLRARARPRRCRQSLRVGVTCKIVSCSSSGFEDRKRVPWRRAFSSQTMEFFSSIRTSRGAEQFLRVGVGLAEYLDVCRRCPWCCDSNVLSNSKSAPASLNALRGDH